VAAPAPAPTAVVIPMVLQFFLALAESPPAANETLWLSMSVTATIAMDKWFDFIDENSNLRKK
jgi:hypothetical protein